jgi:hypothetical protein
MAAAVAAAVYAPPVTQGEFRRDVEMPQFTVDVIPVAVVAGLSLISLLYFEGLHFVRWCSPRLQGYDLRVLGALVNLVAIALIQQLTIIPLLAVRALVESYAVLVACSVVPLLLLGGVARLESQPDTGAGRRGAHRALVTVLWMRAATAAVITGLGMSIVHAGRARKIAVSVDAVFVLVTFGLVATQRAPPAREAASTAVAARRGSRWLVLGALATSALDVLWVWLAGPDSLHLAAATQLYAYFTLIVFCSADLNPRADSILCAMPEKETSAASRIRAICFLPDAFFDVPFDKELFFSLRSAIADDAKEPAESPPPPEIRSESRLVAADTIPGHHDHAYDSEGESIYGAHAHDHGAEPSSGVRR